MFCLFPTFDDFLGMFLTRKQQIQGEEQLLILDVAGEHATSRQRRYLKEALGNTHNLLAALGQETPAHLFGIER